MIAGADTSAKQRAASDPATHPLAGLEMPLGRDDTGRDCLDHVNFVLNTPTGDDDGRPGATVQYQSPPFEADPSGQPVSVAGSAFLSPQR